MAYRSVMHMALSAVWCCTVIDKEIPLDDLTLEEYKAISPVFEEDIYEAISIKTCVEKRTDHRCSGTGCHGKGDSSGIKNIWKETVKKCLIFSENWYSITK